MYAKEKNRKVRSGGHPYKKHAAPTFILIFRRQICTSFANPSDTQFNSLHNRLRKLLHQEEVHSIIIFCIYILNANDEKIIINGAKVLSIQINALG
jgi:hypothetical protein